MTGGVFDNMLKISGKRRRSKAEITAAEIVEAKEATKCKLMEAKWCSTVVHYNYQINGKWAKWKACGVEYLIIKGEMKG